MGELLSGPTGARARLRASLGGPGPLVAPGAHDALAARLVEQAGFEAVYLTGFGTSGSLIGRPDVGLLSAGEMVEQARRLVDAVDIPVIADADTGYGNAINVIRTVRAYEQAGVAALQLEDQVMPKKCGHMSGKAVISAEEMCGKIRAATQARRDPDLVIIARTDAAAVLGLDEAVDRARSYAEAGADVLFVEAPTSEEDITRVAGELRDVAPMVFNWAEGGRTPADVAGPDHRPRLLLGDLPDRDPARRHRRRAVGAGDDPDGGDAAVRPGPAAHLRGVHRPDRTAGGPGAGAALRRVSQRGRPTDRTLT